MKEKYSFCGEWYAIMPQAPSVLAACGFDTIPPGGRPNKFARLRVDGNKCMAGRPILGVLVRSQYY